VLDDLPDPIDATAFAETLAMVDGDRAFLGELIATYREDGARRIEEMRESLDSGDAPQLQRAAHTLKSSSATVGALGLADRCRAVEHAARDGRLDGLAVLVEAIASDFEGVVAALDRRTGDIA
jgi:HPt (histidine-containing phosphotransfer) domain-containing protein